MSFFRKRWQEKPRGPVRLNQGSPIARGLVGCYIFNEGGGPLTHNLAGLNHGTIGGNCSWGYGPGGLGLTIPSETANTGVNCGTVESNHPLALQGGGWTWLVGLSSANLYVSRASPNLLSCGTGGDQRYAFQTNNTNNFIQYINGSASEVSSNSLWADDGNVTAVGWANQKGGDAYWYVNGTVAEAETTSTATPSISADTLALLNRDDFFRTPTGTFYYVYIWDRALRHNDIQMLWADPWQVIAPSNNFAAWLNEPAGAPTTKTLSGGVTAPSATASGTIDPMPVDLSGGVTAPAATASGTIDPMPVDLSGGVTAPAGTASGTIVIAVAGVKTLSGGVTAPATTASGTIDPMPVDVSGGVTAPAATASGTLEIALPVVLSGGVTAPAATASGTATGATGGTITGGLGFGEERLRKLERQQLKEQERLRAIRLDDEVVLNLLKMRIRRRQ